MLQSSPTTRRLRSGICTLSYKSYLATWELQGTAKKLQGLKELSRSHELFFLRCCCPYIVDDGAEMSRKMLILRNCVAAKESD